MKSQTPNPKSQSPDSRPPKAEKASTGKDGEAAVKGAATGKTEASVVMTRLAPIIIAALAALGLLVSLYLTAVHYSDVPLVCIGGVKGCEEVNRSIYSEVGGIAVAALGAVGYLAILVVLWAERQRILKEDEVAIALFGISLLGVLYSAYLTYIELFVLKTICSWCVVSALLLAAIFALSIARLRERLSS